MSMFTNTASDRSHMLYASYALMISNAASIPNEMKPLIQRTSFRDMMPGFTFFLFKAANTSDPISWLTGCFVPMKILFFIIQASSSCIVAVRLGDLVPNPMPKLQLEGIETTSALKTRQAVADAEWMIRFNELYPPEICLFPSEELQGFYILTAYGFEKTLASVKTNVPVTPPQSFPCQTPGMKRVANDDFLKDPVDSDEEERYPGTRIKAEETTERNIQQSAIVVCRLLNILNTKTDARCRAIMGEARLIESQDCFLRMSRILGAIISLNTLPACATSVNASLLKGLFSQHLQVSITGKLEYMKLLAFQPRDLDTQQFPRIKTLSQLSRCLTSLKVVYKRIEDVNDETPIVALTKLTIDDSRSMMGRIFESIAHVLEFAEHQNLDKLNINYIIEQVNIRVHNVFVEFRKASNLLLSKEDFLAAVFPLASITADSLIKGKDSFDSMNASGQMVMNFFTPSFGGGRGRGDRGRGRGADDVRGGGRGDRGRIRGRGRGRGEVVNDTPPVSMCFDYVNYKLGLRADDCARGSSCLYSHVTPTVANKKEVLAAVQAIKGKKFREKIVKAINDL